MIVSALITIGVVAAVRNLGGRRRRQAKRSSAMSGRKGG